MVWQTVPTIVEAPMLGCISTKSFVQFKRWRKLYEKQVQDMNREPSIQIIHISFKSSNDMAGLQILINACCQSGASIGSATEDQFLTCVKLQFQDDENGKRLT